MAAHKSTLCAENPANDAGFSFCGMGGDSWTGSGSLLEVYGDSKSRPKRHYGVGVRALVMLALPSPAAADSGLNGAA